MAKTALVTGGSSGIGRATAIALRDAGCTVYEISRHGESFGGITHLTADVSDEEQVRHAVDELVSREGRLDILVCNAGFGISGAAEFTDNADAKRLLDVNLFGVVNCCKAAAGHMRRQHGGRIVCLSSVAGPVSIPFQAWYSVSKAAVLSYSGSIRNELRRFGITVCAIMPGDIKTGFTASREKIHVGDDVYCGAIERSVAVMEHDEETGMSPETAGRYIAGIALRRNVKPAYAVGMTYKFLCMVNKLMPARFVSFLVSKLYVK